jgi:hypothetical protein
VADKPNIIVLMTDVEDAQVRQQMQKMVHGLTAG